MLDLPRLPTFFQNAFKNGEALLLIDGYDEIAPESQQVITEYFKIILQNYPKTRIVTTGAPEYLDGLIALGFAPLTLMTWSARENEKFIDQWGESMVTRPLHGSLVADWTRTGGPDLA